MVATLDEAFGPQFKKEKYSKKEKKERKKQHQLFQDKTDVFNNNKYSGSTNMNSNSVYQDRAYYPIPKSSPRNKTPYIEVDNMLDTVNVDGIPIESSGDGTINDGRYSIYSQDMVKNFVKKIGYGEEDESGDEGGEENDAYMKYVEEPEERGNRSSLEGYQNPGDYQLFESNLESELLEIKNKLKVLLEGGSDNFSIFADIIYFIIFDIFILILVDIMCKCKLTPV